MQQKPSATGKAWSGRFSEPVAELVKRYTASVEFDQRLAEFDIQGSLAHAAMLECLRHHRRGRPGGDPQRAWRRSWTKSAPASSNGRSTWKTST